MAGLFEDGGDRRRVVDLEQRLDDRGILAGSDEIRLRPGAEDHEDRVDQDRLAGAGLTGQHVEAGLERHDDVFDDGEVTDRELSQHGLSAMLRPRPAAAQLYLRGDKLRTETAAVRQKGLTRQGAT